MRSFHHLKPNGISLNLTPMVDMVFLLIIFFIVSSTLVRQDVSMQIDLPQAESGEPAKEDQKRIITINVPDSQSILLGTSPTNIPSLREYLFRERETDKPVEVRIRTGKDVPYGVIEPILVLCADAGIWDVTFPVESMRR